MPNVESGHPVIWFDGQLHELPNERDGDMTRFKRILCPIDFSEPSRHALRYGGELSRQHHGELVVLFVNDPLLSAAVAAAAYDTRRLAAGTSLEMERFTKKSLRDSPVTPRLMTASGHPAPTIVKTARRIDADLIVMGARGLTAPAKWFAGSTTERILRTTTIPVLVTPSKRRADAAKRAGSRALIPIDVSDASRADVQAAIRMAAAFGAAPVLLHVLPQSPLPPWLAGEAPGLDRERVAEARRSMEALARGSDARYEVAIGRAADEIVAATERFGASIVIMMLRRSNSLLGPRRGVVTYQVLCKEAAPVLALPSVGQDEPAPQL
jgi:nucleotide-binding universal stress UspA family protein